MAQRAQRFDASDGNGDYERRELALPTYDGSALRARQFTRETLNWWQLTDVGDDVVSVVGELVPNAFLHAAGPVTLILRRCGQQIRVEVNDESSQLPHDRSPSEDGTSGRGLVIVASLSREWGARLRGAGKSVWADIDLAAP